MERSGFLKVNFRDVLKGAALAVVAAIVTFAYEAIEAGGLLFNGETLKAVALVAGGAFLSYIIKNVFENTSGELGPE